MKKNVLKVVVVFLSLIMILSFTMCKKFDEKSTENSYNSYSEKYGLSSDDDLKKAMESMKKDENYPIYKDGEEESKLHRAHLLDLYEKDDINSIKNYIRDNNLILGKN